MRTKHETLLKTQQQAIKDVAKVLDKKIIIQKRTSSSNDNNFEEEVWVDWLPLWARKNNLWGKEFYAAKTINEEKTVEFEVRYIPKLEELNSTEYRILHGSIAYNITFIDNVQYRNKWVIIKTEVK